MQRNPMQCKRTAMQAQCNTRKCKFNVKVIYLFINIVFIIYGSSACHYWPRDSIEAATNASVSPASSLQTPPSSSDPSLKRDMYARRTTVASTVTWSPQDSGACPANPTANYAAIRRPAWSSTTFSSVAFQWASKVCASPSELRSLSPLSDYEKPKYAYNTMQLKYNRIQIKYK